MNDDSQETHKVLLETKTSGHLVEIEKIKWYDLDVEMNHGKPQYVLVVSEEEAGEIVFSGDDCAKNAIQKLADGKLFTHDSALVMLQNARMEKNRAIMMDHVDRQNQERAFKGSPFWDKLYGSFKRFMGLLFFGR